LDNFSHTTTYLTFSTFIDTKRVELFVKIKKFQYHYTIV